MIFEDRSVVVEEGQVRSRVDVEVVRSPGVVKVVDHGGHQRSENLEVGNPILKKIKKPFFSFLWDIGLGQLTSSHFISFISAMKRDFINQNSSKSTLRITAYATVPG